MYIPKSHDQNDRAAVLQLIRNEPFATLISVCDGRPVITHIPVNIECVDPELVLGGHIASANPQSATLNGAEVVICFRGPHAYVSPQWYTNQNRNVPTWNYAIVHCTGRATVVEGAEKIEIVSRLVDAMEEGTQNPWSLAHTDDDYRAILMKKIVAFSMRVDCIEASFKLGQDHSAADRAGVASALRASARQSDRDLAALMQDH
ncbi:MAG: FMN-binding negative transcriptional regulator [Candidatus Eremiobacteraeota bacterium]|nr:FMN-binding negative transcriptional regulator [Candidatus Eremiobacteraeota bacterium]